MRFEDNHSTCAVSVFLIEITFVNVRSNEYCNYFSPSSTFFKLNISVFLKLFLFLLFTPHRFHPINAFFVYLPIGMSNVCIAFYANHMLLRNYIIRICRLYNLLVRLQIVLLDTRMKFMIMAIVVVCIRVHTVSGMWVHRVICIRWFNCCLHWFVDLIAKCDNLPWTFQTLNWFIKMK